MGVDVVEWSRGAGRKAKRMVKCPLKVKKLRISAFHPYINHVRRRFKFLTADDSAVGPYFVYHNDLRTILLH
jgi:hypothetical protein